MVIDSRGDLEDAELVELAESSASLILPSTPDLGGMDGMAQTVEVLQEAGYPQQSLSRVANHGAAEQRPQAPRRA